MQDMAQMIDYGGCHLPDYYMYKVMQCACGDTPVRIPEITRTEKSKYWCTGTLRIVTGTGARYIFFFNCL
jgi:hypothetical protein